MAFDDASPQGDGSYPQDPNTITPFDKVRIQGQYIVKPDLFTLYFGFFGTTNWKRNLNRALGHRLENARFVMQRYPTQEELNAFATHGSRMVYHNRIGAPIGGIIGVARLASQLKKSAPYSFLFPHPAGPAGLPSPRQLLEVGRSMLVTEPSNFARMAASSVWSLFFWTVIGATGSSIYAAWKDTTGSITDPRLKEYIAEVRKHKPEELRKRKMEVMQERHRQHVQQSQQPKYDESPQEPGAYAESYNNDNQSQYEPQSSQPRFSKPAEPMSSTGSQEPQSSNFFDDDDASPISPDVREAESKAFQGNAWERIRQQNIGSGLNQQDRQDRFQQQPREQWGAQSNAGFSPDQDRQREREQAQADFDQLLDSERNMSGDASGTGGQNKGWGGRWR